MSEKMGPTSGRTAPTATCEDSRPGPAAVCDDRELRELQRWLATEDYYTSAWVREWLARTPGEAAAEMLARLAGSARPEPHSFLHVLLRGLVMSFTASEIVSDRSPAGRRAGTRAALLLALRGDARSIPPLARVFETSWLWAGKYQDDIEKALIAFLDGPGRDQELSAYVGDLKSLSQRIWGAKRTELPDSWAALLVALAPHLARDEGGRAVLSRLASAAVEAPNRRRVAEAARGLLGSAIGSGQAEA